MYIILVYDIASIDGGDKRLGKMLKHCRKYLNWIQNSVFEGDITDVKLKELLMGAKKIMDEEHDSIILFKSRDAKWLDKQIVGKEMMNIDNFL
ncbi:MAG: CRISPR-associated endonuclease Cas2 [Spirosomataceae bacterium]